MVKKIIAVIITMLFFNGAAMAKDAQFGISTGYGQGSDNIDIYRIGLMKNWGVKWLNNGSGYLDGCFELSYSHWGGRDDVINAFTLSPVFRYEFNPAGSRLYPYIEGGIGVAYIDEYKIKGRDLSSNFHFEDRIGVGFRYNNFDLNFRYMHYSNASLIQPNDGMDILIGTLAYYF